MKKRLVAALLSVCMIGATLTGCSGSNEETTLNPETAKAEADRAKTDNAKVSDSSDVNTVQLMASINTYMAAGGDMDFTYTDTMYGLDEDYVFEFDASDEAGNIHYDAFCVYISEEDMKSDISSMNTNGYHTSGGYCDTSYDNGKIKVAPNGVIRLAGVYEADPDSDPTWGVYNKLYLAQWIDLETGEQLDEPLVTIFSVNHGVDAPVVNQKLDDTNNYTLTWNPVDGATEYSVFVMLDDKTFSYEATTTDTTISVTEFQSEIDTVSMLSSFTIDDTGAFLGMNYSVTSDVSHGYKYVVVAKTNSGISGISNVIDPSVIAASIPNATVSSNPTYYINSAEEAPLYSTVTMADGTDRTMMINYHGAHVYELEDGTIHVSTKFLNTDLACIFDITGIDFATFTANKDAILDKQDSQNVTGGSVDPINNISEVPTSNEEDLDEIVEQIIEDNDIQVESTSSSDDDDDDDDDDEDDDGDDIVKPEDNNNPAQTPTITPGGYSTNELYNATVAKIEETYANYGIAVEDVNSVLYANSQLEAYLGYALMARMEMIPVPADIYPEATDLSKLASIVWVSYRQNPSSGFIYTFDYSYDYESVIVYYVDDSDTRLKYFKEELDKAKEVVASTVDSSMSQEEMVFAFNDYFCERASYDFDSMSTEVNDPSEYSQEFIDAHTPYGILCKDYGVCESYSEAFALVGRMAGLDIIMETGTLCGGPHEWNKVCIDGKYYIVDITNNDRAVAANSLLLVSEKQAKLLAGDTNSYLIDATAYDPSKEYYTVTFGLCDSIEEAVAELESQFSQGNIANVRVGFDATDDDIFQILRTVYTDGYDILEQNSEMNGVIGCGIN